MFIQFYLATLLEILIGTLEALLLAWVQFMLPNIGDLLCQMKIAVCSGIHQVGRDDELGVHLALRIYFETDCPPTNEALEQQEGNSRDTGDDLRRAFELVTASGWFYLHGPILKQSA